MSVKGPTSLIGRRSVNGLLREHQTAADVWSERGTQVVARGDGADAAHDAAVLRDYFNLNTGLAALADGWAARDSRFAAVREYIPGAPRCVSALFCT